MLFRSIAYRLSDFRKALVNFTKAAELGSRDAQYLVGLMYSKGQGTAIDYDQAGHWYRRAAEQGHAGAQTNLGFIYANGLGLPRDFAEAAYWYGQAADQGAAKAQGYLAFMYQVGQGIPKDAVQAHKWFSLLAAGDDATETQNAKRVLALLEPTMTEAEIAEAQRLAGSWRAANQRRD